MQKYTVLAVLTIQAGATLGLTKAQASDRRHAVKALQVDKKTGDGIYQVLEPVQFKRGEVILTDALLNKQLATVLEPIEETEKKAKDQAAAEAAAKDLAAIREKAKAWDDVQQELTALRGFVAEIEALPEPLHKQVAAEVEKQRKAAEAKAAAEKK